MNKITILVAVASLSVSAMPLYAADEHHPEKVQQATPVPKSAATAKPAGTEQAADPQIGQAQETKRKLQELMGKIRQTSDPMERRKLMQEHMRAMQDGMKQMGGMGGGMMMGMGSGGKQGEMMMGMGSGGKQGGMMMGMGRGDKPGGGMMKGDMMKAHNMMKMRMEMMETMMEHMMQREEMRDAMPAK